MPDRENISVNTTKCSSSGSAISEQCVFRESFTFSGTKASFCTSLSTPFPTPHLSVPQELDQISGFLALLTLITIGNTFTLWVSTRPNTPTQCWSKGFYLWCSLIFSILKLPSQLISHVLIRQLQCKNPGFIPPSVLELYDSQLLVNKALWLRRRGLRSDLLDSYLRSIKD